jgi:hypothetical protein
MRTTTSEPPSTRGFFLGTLFLGVTSFIPVIGFLAALLLIFWVIAWIACDARGFSSVLWRTILSTVLIYSVGSLIETFATREHVYVFENQFLTGCVIASSLSAFGLVRSFVKRQID